MGARVLRIGARLGGAKLPAPVHAPLDDPLPLVRWLRATLGAGRIPHVWTFASWAILACEAAVASKALMRARSFCS